MLKNLLGLFKNIGLGKWKASGQNSRISVVSATYNAGPYIDDFLGSFAAQTAGLDNVEIILIDDGSTDDTAEKIQPWIDKYPNVIRYYYQKNQGVTAARNTGLKYATGKWVTFPDPDDFFNDEYLAEVRSEMRRVHLKPLSIIAVNVVRYLEKEDKYLDTHVLRYRFKKRRKTRLVSDMKQHIHGQVATAFFRRDLVEKHQLRFDGKVKPAFEDSHFTNRFLILEPNTSIAFLLGAN